MPGRAFRFIAIRTLEKVGTARRCDSPGHTLYLKLSRKKRQLEQKSGANFRVVSPNDVVKGRAARPSKTLQNIVSTPYCSSINTLDAFQMLVDGLPTLQRLLKVHYSSASMHPVFDVADELVLQNISCLLRKSPDNQLFSMRSGSILRVRSLLAT
ncbi:hypothetical protein EV126DRAFT_97258 [Verticillium dahliae]|nr:hypothetical protein EV126DRAFT_97258 [Verticillium dahliae]